MLVCRKSETNAGVRPSRLVFSGHGPSVPPSREELIEQEVREGVQLEKTQIEGYYLTNPPNPVIETGRLGVRTEIAATLRTQQVTVGGVTRNMTDQDIQEGIINERITSHLRGLAEHHVAEHHQQLGWVGQKLHSVRDTISDMSNPFRAVGRFFGNLRGGNPNNIRYTTSHDRHIEHEMHHLFGHHRDVPHIVGHIIHHINPAHLAAAVGVMGVIPATPAALTAALNAWNVTQLEANMASARRAPDREFIQSYEMLLNVRRIEARERSKILSIEMYDPARLRRFLESMRVFGNDDYKMLTEQILEKGALDNLDENPATQALVTHMLFLYESDGNSITTLHNHLQEIRDGLPMINTSPTQPEGDKPENVKTAEKIDELSKAVKDNSAKMLAGYRKAAPTARLIGTLNAQLATLTAAGGAAMDAKVRAEMVKETQKKILDLEVKRSDILQEVNQSEQEYKDSTNELVRFLMKSQNQTALPGGVPNLIALQGVNTMSVSTEAELFRLPVGGPPPVVSGASTLELHAATLNTTFFNTLTSEIDTNYKTVIRARERISARHLLVSLKEKRMQDNGVLDEGRRLKMAIFSANLMIADVKSVDLYRAGNREIAETMITGWAGWRRRASQSIASKYFNSNTFTARDIIDHVAEVDVDKKFQFLKDLNPESSLADLRHHLHEHHVHIDDLAAARTHLQKVLEGLQVGHHDRVEIADTSWTIENLVHNLLVLETELESRAFFDEVQNPVNPEDKKLHKGAYLKKLWAQTYESDQKRQEAVAAKLQNFPNTLKKYLMKGTWGKQYEEGLKEAKAKGFSGEALKEYLQNEKKIPGAVLKHLMTGLAVKEAYDIGKGTIGWIGGKLGKGVKGVAKFGAEKGGTVLSSAWERLGKPALYASGRGLKKAGKFALWDAPKFALWTTPKFFMWDAPVWTVKKATKAAVWPFKMAGRALSGFWNFFHYTPEKAARDKAWYEAKKSASGGHGGHGDGHGGGHGGHGGH